MRVFLIAFISIGLSVAAQFSLKAGMSSSGIKGAFTQPFSIDAILLVITNKFLLAGFAMYGIGAVVWLGVLSRWDVSKAYPLVGLGFVLTAAIGFCIGEQVSASRFFGIALICAGVFVVSQT